MKVSEIKYERAEFEKTAAGIKRAISGVKNAKCAEDVLKAREIYVNETVNFSTFAALSYMRYTINTADEFYAAEKRYYDETEPKLQELILQYNKAMLESPFRAELEERLSRVLFSDMEVAAKAVSPFITEEMIQENGIITEYSDLMASLEFEFRGETMPRTVLMKYFSEDDRNTRREAYEAMGAGFKKVEVQLDDIFDRLVKVRNKMAVKMGYRNFVELGYYRMGRLCYDEKMVKSFRENVVRDIVPLVARLKKSNAEKMGIFDFKMYDDGVTIPGGDPKPSQNKDDIFRAAVEMYHEMGEETGKFIDMMMQTEAFDVVSRKNKWGGGYCTSFAKFRQPFILANFNGTSGDVDVVTHEAGHALADYLTYDNRFKAELDVGGMETAETHSMSMEFFAWRYMDKFFGKDADKYRFMHAFSALSFIPYGTMVDHFQHIVYEKPNLTPRQRKETWLELEKIYRPYMSLEGIPYIEDGNRWQYQMHIFETPFYYIDYCLAQTAAFGFLIKSLEDYDGAFEKYIEFIRHSGERVFTDLLRDADIPSPFEDGALGKLADNIEKLLKKIEV